MAGKRKEKKLQSPKPKFPRPRLKSHQLKFPWTKIGGRLSSLENLSFLWRLKNWRLRSKKTMVLVITISIIFGIYWSIFRALPSPRKLSSRQIPQTTKIYDRQGKLLYEIYADQNRTLVPLSDIPDSLKKATIAIEDKDFYRHGGINPIGGILRALKEIVLHRHLQGGSTLTQQLVKSALLTPERTVQRKLKEFILASLVEKIYSKDQILEMYFNQVPYGGTAWGVEAAAQTYLGKHVKDLTLAESALLAGLPAAPTTYSPFGAHPELAKERQKEVLQQMLGEKFIKPGDLENAEREELKFTPQKTNILAPHFVMYIKDQLVQKYGQQMVEQGGLKVTTTLDWEIQDFAQTTVASEVAKLKPLSVSNGATLVTRPPTGEILAMVGSKDYFASGSGNFNVALALRQPGSAIKPINYALGLANGIVTPATVFIDKKTCFPNPDHAPYCPQNYDGQFHGPVQLRFALGNSYNIPAVKMLKLNGVEDMVSTATAMGISTFTDPSRYGLSLTLGGGEVTMLDMAKSFGIFANAGIKKDLVSILKVEDSKGKVLEETKISQHTSSLDIEGPRVLPAEVTYLISHILLDNNARSAAFGTSSYLVVPGHPAVSVKTGTTDDKRDNWTIGWNPSFLTVTWVGNNDNSPMNPYLSSGITGAAPIWNKIMARVLKDKPDEWPRMPQNVIGREVCAISGKLPGDSGCPTRYEYFIRGKEPTETETNYRQPVVVDKNTGKLAEPDQKDNLETRDELIITDPLKDQFCLSCPL